jgi:adenosine deaminase
LLTHDIIGFEQLQACQDAAFRHAFAWNYEQRPVSMLNRLMKTEASV